MPVKTPALQDEKSHRFRRACVAVNRTVDLVRVFSGRSKKFDQSFHPFPIIRDVDSRAKLAPVQEGSMVQRIVGNLLGPVA